MEIINKKDILILEGDKNILPILTSLLLRKGFSTKTTQDSEVAIKLVENKQYDCIIALDELALIGQENFMYRLRQEDIRTPVIILSEKNDLQSQINSYEANADVFHSKPINYELLLSQIGMLTRRHFTRKEVNIGDIRIDPNKALVYKAGRVLNLTNLEFNLFMLLSATPGVIYTRSEILTLISTKNSKGYESSVDTLVSRLRKKVGKYKGSDAIETIFKKGYRLSVNYLN